MKSKSLRFFQSAAVVTVLANIPAVSMAANVDWKGSTGSYNNPTAWNSGSLPTAADNIFVNVGTVQINSGDPNWAAGEIRMGATATSSSIVQNGPDVTIASGKWLRMGIAAGSTSTYILNSGTLTTPTTVYVGEAGTAVLNVEGGIFNKTSAGTLIIGNRGASLGGASSSGTVNQTAGTVTSAAQIWLGWQFNATVGNTTSGTYNFSGGTLNANNFLTVGRAGGNGLFNMTGGILNKNATGSLVIGSKDNVSGSTGAFTQSAGTINAAGIVVVGAGDNLGGTTTGSYTLGGLGILNANNSISLGSNGGTGTITMTGGTVNKNATGIVSIGSGTGGTGIINQSGGTFSSSAPVLLGDTSTNGGSGTWNLSGTAVANLGTLTIGSGASNAQGTFNLNGGTLNVGRITSTSTGVTREFNFNGGTLKAVENQANYMEGLSAANVKSGGAIIHSNGFNIGLGQALLDGGAGGGLTKNGMGTLTLQGENTYTGATTINDGIVALGSNGTIDNSSGVSLGTNGTFDVSAKTDGYSVKELTGSGGVIGTLTISNQLAIGSSPGSISFSNGLTLGASATYQYEVTGGATTADLGIVTGDLTLHDGSVLEMFQLGTYTLNDKFTLFSYTGSLAGTFSGLADDSTFSSAGEIWQINYDDTSAGLNGGSVTGASYITVTAVPEPAAILLGVLGLIPFLRRRR